MSKRSVRNVRNRPIRTNPDSVRNVRTKRGPLGPVVSDADIPPNYLMGAIKAIVGNIKPGTVMHMQVEHDHHCALLNGRGVCNCKPDVRMVKPS